MTFALQHLVSGVTTALKADGVKVDGLPVAVLFGWNERANKLTRGGRVVFVPGDDATKEAGQYVAPQTIGDAPRKLAQLDELFTLYVEATDSRKLEDDPTQYAAVRCLHDSVFAAMYATAFGTFQLSKPQWYGDQNERRAGATMRIVGKVQAPIFEAAHDEVPADTSFSVPTTELDVTETVTATKEN